MNGAGCISPRVIERGRRLEVEDAVFEVRCPVQGCAWQLTTNAPRLLEPGFVSHAEQRHQAGA